MMVERLGPEKAKSLFPLNVNPDEVRECPASDGTGRGALPERRHLDLASDRTLMALPADQAAGWRLGSNNWATGAALSASGRPIVANDPHLDARILPGPWYPCGLILPASRIVAAFIPGVPGLGIGRTDRIALGITNSYGDAQDLFIETVDPADPGRYLEGENSLPFEVITETLKIKDKGAPGGFREEKIAIRLTKRGPVVSGILKGLDAEPRHQPPLVALRDDGALPGKRAPAYGSVTSGKSGTTCAACPHHAELRLRRCGRKHRLADDGPPAHPGPGKGTPSP
jgi:penicillin amidase